MQPTETHSRLNSLTPVQNLAIGTLLTGSIVAAAAKTVGVSRKTLHRWLKNNPHFIAELHRRRTDLSRPVHDRLRAVVLTVLDIIGKAVASGDAQTKPLAQTLQQGEEDVESETFGDTTTPDRLLAPPITAPPTCHCPFPVPDPLPSAMCESMRQSGTFADKPGRTQNESPTPHQAPPPKTREERVESETSAPPSRAVLCPDTRRETNTPEKRPDKIESLRTSSPHPLSPTPDSLPPEICDNTGQSETSAASPAHLPASDVQLLTSNSQLLASTSPPPQKTCEECVESETFGDTTTPDRGLVPQLRNRPLANPHTLFPIPCFRCPAPISSQRNTGRHVGGVPNPNSAPTPPVSPTRLAACGSAACGIA